MKKKILIVIISFLISIFSINTENEYENELSRFEEIPNLYSNFNHDLYNDYLDEFNTYFNAMKKYLSFLFFKKEKLDKESYTYNDVTLLISSNNYTFKKEKYSLCISFSNDYISYDIKSNKKMFLYICNDYINLKVVDRIFFIKDKYRISVSEDKFLSLYNYQENLFLDENLYSVFNNELFILDNEEKENEMRAIANIYLTEYF